MRTFTKALAVGAYLILTACGNSKAPISLSGIVEAPVFPALKCAPGPLAINVLSNRADLISDGNALIGITLPAGTDLTQIRVTAAGRDVSDVFKTRANGCYQGLVEGLALGSSDLMVFMGSGSAAKITVTNHPNGGPVFSGPQLSPWPCNSAGALDDQCNHQVEYSLWYYTGNAPKCAGNNNVSVQAVSCGFAPYNTSIPTALIPTVTTDQGKQAPFIVRVEKGWQDRDVYQIAVLFDPSKPWSGVEPQETWNHKVLVTQGAGCGTHHGEDEAPGTAPSPGGAIANNFPGEIFDNAALSRGFAVMSTALTNSTHNCNLVVQAESIMMAKERLIENYGQIRFTIAQGCSGGSLSLYQTANAYPGLYQGLLPSCTFMDAWSSGMNPYDCFLLTSYWKNPALWAPGVAWTPDQLSAVGGSETPSVCEAWIDVYSFYPTIFPQKASPVDSKGGALDLQNCGLLATETYDATTNPKGTRCGLSDVMVNVFGVRAGDGFANRALDNTGLQYGLVALKSGAISAAQFVDINAKVGSRDVNWVQASGREAATGASLVNAYRSGAINEATTLNQAAIIDLSAGTTDIHESWRAFAVRARMDAAYGHHNNQVIWYTNTLPGDPLTTMDQWLTKVEADTRSVPFSEKIVEDKPKGLKDKVDLVYYTGTRGAADMPLPRDIAKCQLKPLSRADYTVTFSDSQWSQLQQIFPTGVCDWTKPGVGQQPNIPWMQYGDSSTHIYGGAPLGPAPQSVTIR